MKYPNKQEHQGVSGRRSSSVAINPYFIEDIAMTPGEFARARATDNVR